MLKCDRSAVAEVEELDRGLLGSSDRCEGSISADVERDDSSRRHSASTGDFAYRHVECVNEPTRVDRVGLDAVEVSGDEEVIGPANVAVLAIGPPDVAEDGAGAQQRALQRTERVRSEASPSLRAAMTRRTTSGSSRRNSTTGTSTS